MTAAEQLLLDAALAAIAKIEPELAKGVSALVDALINKKPLEQPLLHIEVVAAAKALGLDPAKV